MIWDCFTFFNEVDILEIRLEELSDIVDRFVIVEGMLSFSGNPHALVYPQSRKRFAKWADKIDYVVMADYSGVDTGHSWSVEYAQHQVGLDFILDRAGHDDLMIYGDCDEIPRASSMGQVRDMDFRRLGIEMPMYYYRLNLRVNKTWKPTRVVRLDGTKWQHRQIRRRRPDSSIRDAGWHFSYMGDIKLKIDSFSHVEYARPPYNDLSHIMDKVNAQEDLFGRPMSFSIESDLSRMPECVKNNVDKYRRMLI